MVTSRFFKTFSAATHPVEPRGELSFEEAQLRSTYYEAQYDDAGRLCEFSKHLYERDAEGNLRCAMMFSEGYEYWPSGRLKTRRLTRGDGAVQSWDFDDKPRIWSHYISEWLERWFGRSKKNAEQRSLSSRLNVCHELASEIEISAFGSTPTSPQGSAWAVAALTERLADFRGLFELILPRSKPRISILAATGGPAASSLVGFDELFGIGVLGDVWDRLAESKDYNPADVIAMASQDADVQEWLKAQEIAAALTVPVRAIRAAKTTPEGNGDRVTEVVGHLVLWLAKTPTVRESAAIASILRRIGSFAEDVIDRASREEPIRDVSQ